MASIVISYYAILLFLGIATIFGCYFINKKHGNSPKFLKTFSLILGFIFLCRYMLGTDAIQNSFALENDVFDSKFITAIALFLIWFTYSSNLLLILFPFFNIERLKGFIKFISLPMCIINVLLLTISLPAIIGNGVFDEISLRGVVLSIEYGFALGYAIFLVSKVCNQNIPKENTSQNLDCSIPKHLNNSFVQKTLNIFDNIGKFFKKNWFSIFAVLIIFLSTMPPYTLQTLFGDFPQVYKAKDFEIPHRIILYVGLILPVILHFTLKNKLYAEKKFYLLFICLGTLISFSFTRRFDTFLDPTSWPLHLCNTAMYIMPIVLIFNMKRFFYFTYFINVMGAFLAMLMPNYGDLSNLFSSSLDAFYINHYIAFFMPILFVSLDMFGKPKFRQFTYSMAGFLAYFVLVLVLNAMFTGMFEAGMVSSTTDYFFINSDFVADKLGSWAERLRDITAVITIGGVNLTFYPIYQILFFVVYVLLGFGVWFIYEQGYAIANSFEDMKQRRVKIKIDQYALYLHLNGRSMKEPMETESANKMILNDFSKRYGNSDVFAVKNANLVVNGGEIFGFLGPNGAGKSTIIKSVVGIQPITSGQILVCGYDVDTQGVEAKRQIGFVPDHYALYEKLTGREYINYIADLYNVSLEDRNERINNYVNRFELQNAFDNQIKTYSHGMKQKIAIMSALVHNPKVWILDEPLTGLDPNSIFQVKECMKEHARNGNIVFFSSHIIDVVERICDKIAIIKKGEILLSKSVAEIEQSGDTLENFYMRTINGEDYIKDNAQSEENRKEIKDKSKTKTTKSTTKATKKQSKEN